MIEENMLRGSLVTSNEAKGGIAYKGERGYSNYEIYVKNGGTMTEQEWLEHFGVDLTGYAKTSEVIEYVGDLEDLETTDKTDIVSAINEHQSSIDALDELIYTYNDYSGVEKKCGTWIDGKPIYRKVVAIGELPNNSNKQVAHNINNIKKILKCTGYAYAPTSGSFVNIPYSSISANSIDAVANTTYIVIYTHADQTAFSECYMTIEYTKTTD